MRAEKSPTFSIKQKKREDFKNLLASFVHPQGFEPWTH